MQESKMGFKHTMLKRLNNFQTMSGGQTSPSLGSDDGQATGCTTVTDFSISRILSEDKMEQPQIKTKKLEHRMGADILDLSKTSAQVAASSISPINPPASNAAATTASLSSYHQLMHADFIAATKFYAHFLPQMFPAYSFPACTPTSPTSSAKYFAPYILNTAQTPSSSNATLPRLQSTQQPFSYHIPPTACKTSCPRLDCYECTADYYKHLPLKPKAIPATQTIQSPVTAGTYAKQQSTSRKSKHSTASPTYDLQLNTATATTISLTAVTNINLSARYSNTAKYSSPIPSSGSSNTCGPEEISYKCRICDKVFGCLQTLQAHEKTHKSPRYECTDCGKGFSQLRNYKYHISVHRGTKEFAAECPECGKTFNDKGYLSSHMKIHRNKKEYECPYCPKSFNQRVAFNMHVRIHTGVKPHKCNECGKRFSRKMLLKQHMRTHSGEKPYQCSVCGKSFADRSNMTLHHRLHSGIKPFSCPICPKAFTKKHHLKTHLNYHTGCKPYVCPHPNCNQAFTQSSNMRTHAKKCQYKPLEYPAFAESTQPLQQQQQQSSTGGNSGSHSSLHLDHLNALNAARLLRPSVASGQSLMPMLAAPTSTTTATSSQSFPPFVVQPALAMATANLTAASSTTSTALTKLRPF